MGETCAKCGREIEEAVFSYAGKPVCIVCLNDQGTKTDVVFDQEVEAYALKEAPIPDWAKAYAETYSNLDPETAGDYYDEMIEARAFFVMQVTSDIESLPTI